MSSLSAHLRLPDDHSGLPFHASCPVCRQDRLAGSLEGDEIVSRRTQAAIAAGVLAFSGVGAPGAAVAATEPDQEIDGSAEVIESPEPEEATLEESTIEWADGGAAPVDDEAPLPEAEDGMIDAAASEPVEEEPVIEAAGDEPAAEAEVEPAPEPVAVAAPPAEAPPAETTVTPAPAASDGVRVDTARRAKRERPVERTKSAAQPSVILAPAPVVTPVTTPTVTVRVAAGTNQNTVVRASRGDRVHVVQRGESLWSIATDRLGDDASSDRVAREVQRLWELNAERIGTGSPDLLYAGTRLRLR